MPSELTYKDINLGSFELDQLVDSAGMPLIEAGTPNATSNYTFELGTFASGFVPTNLNLEDWATNWRTFEVGQYAADPDLIGFQGGMTVDGFTVSEDPLAETSYDFSTADAYIWIYNDTAPGVGTEWFVGRADSWVFPDSGLFDPENCCPGELPINWSTSDLISDGINDDVPLYGSQSGVLGEGTYTQLDSGYTLQTFGVIPEPATVLLPAIIGVFVIFKRLRQKGGA